MEIQGIISEISDQWTSATGKFQKQGFAIRTPEGKDIYAELQNDDMRKLNGYTVNAEVIITITPESRNWQGRWYTSLKCTAIRPANTDKPAEKAPF